MSKALQIVNDKTGAIAVNGKFAITPVGLRVLANPSFEDWEQFGRGLQKLECATQWTEGDWLNYGERRWGEKYAQAIDETGSAYQTLANRKYVSSQIDFSLRREKLSWSHHCEVASDDYTDDQRRELLAIAERDDLSVAQFKQYLRRRQQGERLARPLPTGKYQVIYADPPWQYSNSGFDQSAEAQYPTMPTDEICALPIGALAGEESVLFLWATSPLLPDALRVMQAWGFEYKASMVWVKDNAPGMGWYVNTYHEFLLIGGNLHPAIKPDSVFKSPVTKHSQKPQAIYGVIESMYPGNKIELFARQTRDGWECWGNE